MIPFNIPAVVGNEIKYIREVMKNRKFSGDGKFTYKCQDWFKEKFLCEKVLLTTSCTHALELAAILIDTKEGDEIIMPSFTFVSTANAFVLRGAKIIFVDIRPDTMNINENHIEQAITEKTKAIVPVHYAGVPCEMDKIMKIADKYNLFVIEDAAQGVMSKYKEKYLGTIGHFGCYSFHETKNYQCGEGGALVINDERFIERSEILREKGTNRSKFYRGEVDKYSWVDMGSSYLPSELNAAYLYAQLEKADAIKKDRLRNWNIYYNHLKKLEDVYIELPYIPSTCDQNAHMFYIKVKNQNLRSELITFLKKNNVMSVFHYIPLHSSIAGAEFGEFRDDDQYTTKESECLLRLPLYFGLKKEQVIYICRLIEQFYNTISN